MNINQRPTTEYISRFKKWSENAVFRSKDHPTLKDFEKGLDFFSRKLAVLLTHPKVKSLPESQKQALLVHQLYVYLEFTVWLELGPVNEVCNLIRMPNFLPWLPKEMKDDALKIYVDEGAHAEMAHAIISKIEDYTNSKSLKIEPNFLMTLDQIILSQPIELEKMIKVFFVIISETLITGTLKLLPKDETVQIAVREFATDHAIDEGKHHAYFKQLFEFMWVKMPKELQITIGCLLPKMILGFLYPDFAALEQILLQFFVPDEAKGIIKDLEESDAVLATVRNASIPTLNMLKQNKLFEVEEISASFNNYELLK